MLINFLKRHTLKQILMVILEDHLRFIVGSLPGYEGVWLRRLVYRPLFKKIGKNSLITFNVNIEHAYNITAGDYLGIGSGSYIDGRGGIEFGDFVLIGPNVFIGSSNHISSNKNNQPRMFCGHKFKPVKVGSNVWVGANAVICPGVTIGDGSIIAAGSVVTKNVPSGVLFAGNPAVAIKNIE